MEILSLFGVHILWASDVHRTALNYWKLSFVKSKETRVCNSRGNVIVLYLAHEHSICICY